MKALLDTSVLVPATYSKHPLHGKAFQWLQEARAGKLKLFLSTHSLAETYAVLTALPVRPRVAPATAHGITSRLALAAQVVALTVDDYLMVIERLAALGISGGAIYDALTARAAERAEVDQLVTFDVRHLQRAWPAGRDRISFP